MFGLSTSSKDKAAKVNSAHSYDTQSNYRVSATAFTQIKKKLTKIANFIYRSTHQSENSSPHPLEDANRDSLTSGGSKSTLGTLSACIS